MQGGRWERVVQSSGVKPVRTYGRAAHDPEHRPLERGTVMQGGRWERVVQSSGVKPVGTYGRAAHDPEHRPQGMPRA